MFDTGVQFSTQRDELITIKRDIMVNSSDFRDSHENPSWSISPHSESQGR